MTSENGVWAADEAASSVGSGVYIDVENLHPDGQTVIDALLDGWPDDWPEPSQLSLYTRADQAELWRVWAEHRFGHLRVAAHGTQHFSWSSTKNSADIAIAINAISDLVLQRVNNVVVLSDDSDFISLYVAIRDEQGIPRVEGRAPFLWAVTDRKGPLSTTVEQFFPPTHLHVVSADRNRHSRQPVAAVDTSRPLRTPPPAVPVTVPARPVNAPPVNAAAINTPPPEVQPALAPVRTPAMPANTPSPEVQTQLATVTATVTAPVTGPATPAETPPADDQQPVEPPAQKPGETHREMAKAVVKSLPVGSFKSGDAQAIIKKEWPTHHMAKASGGSFGTDFKNRIWPVLETWGVRIPNHGKKPIQYEMTTEAKEAVLD
jgi:hypothetical protein